MWTGVRALCISPPLTHMPLAPYPRLLPRPPCPLPTALSPMFLVSPSLQGHPLHLPDGWAPWENQAPFQSPPPWLLLESTIRKDSLFIQMSLSQSVSAWAASAAFLGSPEPSSQDACCEAFPQVASVLIPTLLHSPADTLLLSLFTREGRCLGKRGDFVRSHSHLCPMGFMHRLTN